MSPQYHPTISNTREPTTRQRSRRPLFIYGTLQARSLLALALTGDASNTDAISCMLCPAVVHGFTCYAVKNGDYPAAVESPEDPYSSIDGYLIELKTASQRRKQDKSEGELYAATTVMASVLDANNIPTGHTVEADMYVWNGDMEMLSVEPWDLDFF